MSDSSNVEDRPKSKRVGALRGLVPFLWPYRGMAALALLALMPTAGDQPGPAPGGAPGGGRVQLGLATMLMRWSRNMPKPATEWPNLAAHATRMTARPSFKLLYEREGWTEWA